MVSVLVHASFRRVTVFRISRHSIAYGFFQLQILLFTPFPTKQLAVTFFLILVIIPGISSITPNLPDIVCWLLKMDTHSWLLTHTQPFQISPEGEQMKCWKAGPKGTHIGWSVWYGNYCLSLDLRQLREEKKIMVNSVMLCYPSGFQVRGLIYIFFFFFSREEKWKFSLKESSLFG